MQDFRFSSCFKCQIYYKVVEDIIVGCKNVREEGREFGAGVGLSRERIKNTFILIF